MTEGVVTYQIIEGRLSAVDVEGNRWFRSSYFKSDFSLTPALLLTSCIAAALATFARGLPHPAAECGVEAGLRPGEGILDVRVEERTPYRLLSSTTTTSHPLWERTGASSPYGTKTSLATEMYSLGNTGDPKVSIRCSISSMRSRSTPMTRL